MNSLFNFFKMEIFSVDEYSITIFTVLSILFVIGVTRLILWIIKKILFRNQNEGDENLGNIYAIYQIIKYFLWVSAIAIILEIIGFDITLLLAGSAALLVGVGLGLQQIFNDFISGIIILSERSIKIGDILEVDGSLVRMQKIGLRASSAINRNNISVIIPNSTITCNKVINWSHQTTKTRFGIEVGVSYNSDIGKVEKVLIECASKHPSVDQKSNIEVRITNFNNSSVDFELLFFSDNVFFIERVKSDIRKIIFNAFAENDIHIPYPQMDLHFVSEDIGLKKQ